MKKKAAIDLLMEQIGYKDTKNVWRLALTRGTNIQEIYNMAKILEKEQIIRAYAENIDSMYPPEIGDEMCEDYYNETYKQD